MSEHAAAPSGGSDRVWGWHILAWLDPRSRPSAAQPLTNPTTVLLAICTRDRLNSLEICLDAIGKLTIPATCTLKVAIVDNSDGGQEMAIRGLAAQADVPVLYAHEPRRGYSTARNAALQLALTPDADPIIFIDDDHAVTPDMIAQYLACFTSLGADVVKGIVSTQPKTPTTRLAHKIATSNVAFRRWLISDRQQGGAGLRFSSALNLTGYEDHQFFYDAQAKGARCVRTTRARATPISYLVGGKRPCVDRRAMALAAGRNRVYAAKVRYGWFRAIFHATRMTAWKLPRCGGGLIWSQMLRMLGPAKAQQARAAALDDWATVCGAITGLHRPGLDRAAAKSGALVEIERPQ